MGEGVTDKREGYIGVLAAKCVRQGRVGRAANGGRATRTPWDLYLECGHMVRRMSDRAYRTVKCERCRYGFSRDWERLPKKDLWVQVFRR